MRRIALLSLTLMVSGCGYKTWWNPPFSEGYNPNMPVENSLNMSRVRGEDVAVTPLVPEPGDIWPGPLPPPRTLQDLERQTPLGSQPALPTRGSPLNRAGNPLLAPLPGGAATPTDAPRGGFPILPPANPPRGTAPGKAPVAAPPADRRIIVPNGNGTSTVIHPDGRIETIPTPP